MMAYLSDAVLIMAVKAAQFPEVGVVKLVVFICVWCCCNEVKKVIDWPTDFTEKTPGVLEHPSSVAAVLSTDCPGEKKCQVVDHEMRVEIGDFTRRFGRIVMAVGAVLCVPVFVPLYYDDIVMYGVEGEEEVSEFVDDVGDDVGSDGEEDTVVEEDDEADVVSSVPCVRVFSKEEIESMFRVECSVCSVSAY